LRATSPSHREAPHDMRRSTPSLTCTHIEESYEMVWSTPSLTPIEESQGFSAGPDGGWLDENFPYDSWFPPGLGSTDGSSRSFDTATTTSEPFPNQLLRSCNLLQDVSRQPPRDPRLDIGQIPRTPEPTLHSETENYFPFDSYFSPLYSVTPQRFDELPQQSSPWPSSTAESGSESPYSYSEKDVSQSCAPGYAEAEMTFALHGWYGGGGQL